MNRIRSLSRWATFCVWAFIVAEICWHLSHFVRRYDILEIPLAIPYAPIAVLLDPNDMLLNHGQIFFIALGNWFGIFLVGAVIVLLRSKPDSKDPDVPCPKCDYDLRGRMDTHCPECGGVFTVDQLTRRA